MEEIAEATQGTIFTHAVSTATQTSSSMPALATGSYTDEIDTWGLPESGPPAPLAEVLREFNYHCGLWTDNFLFGADYNYDRGFDGGDLGKQSWKKKLSMAVQRAPGNQLFLVAEWLYFNLFKRFRAAFGSDENFYRPARILNELSLQWLLDQSHPVFCWLHYMDTHHPYEPPRDYLDRYEFNTSRSRSELSQFTREVIKSNGHGYSKSEIRDVQLAYSAACEYQGDQVLSYISKLKDIGAYDPDKDIFVLTADHGEILSYNEYDMMGHVPPVYWEEAIRVPLVVSIPDWPQTKITDQVSLINLYNTVISAVESYTDLPTNNQKPTPTDLMTQNAFFVTEWEVPNSNQTIKYRGVRSDTGVKLFGGRIKEKDQIVLAEYKVDNLKDDVIYITDDARLPEVPEQKALWEDLMTLIEQHGFIFDDSTELHGGVDEEHLRNLGYLD